MSSGSPGSKGEGWTGGKKAYDENGNEIGSGDNIPLGKGESVTITYEITATRSVPSESKRIEGQICVTNGGSEATQGLAIEDTLTLQSYPGPNKPIVYSGSVDVSSNSVLDTGETGCYPYSIGYSYTPGATYKNTAHITITNHSGSIDTPKVLNPSDTCDFPSTPTEIDESATIVDDVESVLSALPSGFKWERSTSQNSWTLNGSGTITYTVKITNESGCGDESIVITNTATLTEKDTKQVRSDDATVTITPPECAAPPSGCTYTLGYWKNHPEMWPSSDQDYSLFFLSGKSWLEVLKTQPKGNAYYILAHQYIATQLNVLNGASSTEVDEAIAWAEDLFGKYGPTTIPRDVRSQATSCASLLDQYNNGYIGPGHCNL